MTSPPDLPAQACDPELDDIAGLKRIIARLELVDDGFGVSVLHRIRVTLQQHERLMTALREPTEDLQDALAEAFDAAFLPAWREAIKKHGTNNVQPAWASWGRKYLTAIADALDTAPPETKEKS